VARRGFPAEIVLPLCGLALLVAAIHHHDPPAWDASVLLWLHRYNSPAGERLMRGVSAVGAWFGVVPFSVLVVGWLLWRRRFRAGLFFALSMLAVRALETAGKAVLGRHRPSLWLSSAPQRSFGFPSGHALAAMALATALGVLAWPTRARWWVVGCGACFVLLVSTARLYLGVHYPTDVLGAWLAALAWVMVLRRLLLTGRGTTGGPASASGQVG
jgi:undecaprenyl-diphosphatase